MKRLYAGVGNATRGNHSENHGSVMFGESEAEVKQAILARLGTLYPADLGWIVNAFPACDVIPDATIREAVKYLDEVNPSPSTPKHEG